MKLPPVLYVVPVYNAEKWLEESITSLQKQEYEGEIHILCVDDGSTDATRELLDQLKRTVSYFDYYSQRNAGPGAAFNYGIEYADKNGFEFVARMDADDISLPRRTRKEIDALIQFPDACACSCSAVYFAGSSGTIGKSNLPLTPEHIRREIDLGGRGLIQGATIFRTSALKAIGGYRALKTPAEDTDIFLRLAEHYPMINISDTCYKIRICDESHSLKDIYYTRLYHHYYLYLAGLRRLGNKEASFEAFVKQLTWISRNSVKREAIAIRAYFSWMTKRSVPALLLAATLEPRRTIRRLLKKLFQRIA